VESFVECDVNPTYSLVVGVVVVLQLLEDMLIMFDLMQLWYIDSNSVELEQIGLRILLAFCANGVLDVSLLFYQLVTVKLRI